MLHSFSLVCIKKNLGDFLRKNTLINNIIPIKKSNVDIHLNKELLSESLKLSILQYRSVKMVKGITCLSQFLKCSFVSYVDLP